MMASRGYIDLLSKHARSASYISILEKESIFSNKNLKIHIGGNLLSKFTWNITRRTSIKVNHMLYKAGL